MTSVLRRYALIDPRVQFMVALDDCSGHTYQSTSNITSGPVMSATDFASAYPPSFAFLTGDMVKDLGRSINVYDTAVGNNLLFVYRQVMLVNNSSAEGITGKIAYVCTWSADGTTRAQLARIG